MTECALATVLSHPRIKGTRADRVSVAEAMLVARAQELAKVLGLEDIEGLLVGASCLAAAKLWDGESER